MSRNYSSLVRAALAVSLCLSAASAWAAPAPAGIRSYAPNVPVNNPALDDPTRRDGQSEPSIAALNNFVLVVWNDGRGASLTGTNLLPSPLCYGYSTDGGLSFTTGGSPPTQVLGGLWASEPVVTVDETTGHFYLCGLFDPDNINSLEEHGVAVARADFVGSTVVWTRPVVVKSLLATDGGIDQPWAAVDPGTGNVYVTYRRLGGAGDSIVTVRSTDLGLHWGPQIPMQSADAAGRVERPRVAVGPAGEVYVVWKELARAQFLDGGRDTLRIRRSNDAGLSFGPEHTIATYTDNFASGAPGFGEERGVSAPAIAVDRSTGTTRGRVYVAWTESVDFYDSIPDTTVSPVLAEQEPNESAAAAQPFTPGMSLKGNFDTVTDLDYFSFSATQGTSYIFWASEVTSNYTLRLFCSDGVTRLAFSGDRNSTIPNQGLIVWTCPQSGSYYLRMAFSSGAPGRYRVDTAVDTPGGPNQRARDARDVVLSSSPDGTTWSTPVLLTAGQAPWFDNWLPEIAVTPGGTLYAAWYDYADAPAGSCAGQATTTMARSDDGGATWAWLGPVSESFSNWTTATSNLRPNQGDYLGLFANQNGVYPCWTDTRAGNNADIWAAHFALNSVMVAIEAVASDTNHVAITWRAMGPYPASAEVLRSPGTGAYQPIGSVTFGTAGRASFDDISALVAGRYRYALRLTFGASLQVMGEVTVTTGGTAGPPLAFIGAYPNPNPGSLRIRFSLPDNVKADIRLYDVTGRPLRWFAYQGAGAYDVDFGAGLDLNAGLYFLRFNHGRTETIRRVSIVR